jgi:hypothetical protein
MTRNATFEFMTNLRPNKVLEDVSKLWTGIGYDVDIYTLETCDAIKDSIPLFCSLDYKNSIILFCTLDYVYGEPEEEQMIRKVANYLIEIAIDHRIYYYRYSEAMSMYSSEERRKEPTKITVDDLFYPEYEPSLSGNIDLRYMISS